MLLISVFLLKIQEGVGGGGGETVSDFEVDYSIERQVNRRNSVSVLHSIPREFESFEFLEPSVMFRKHVANIHLPECFQLFSRLTT